MKRNNFWKNKIRESAVLNPVDRISEVLFGLIMVLTFTGAISVATDERQDIRELLWAAIGCNLAWGLVDAIMYLMSLVIERGHALKTLRKISESENKEESRTVLKEEIQPLISYLLTDTEADELVQRMKKLPKADVKNLLTGMDFLSAFQIFVLVSLCTLPVAIPFKFIDDVELAVRASNGVALILLFTGGYKLAQYSGFKPIPAALIYMLLGVMLVMLTMALGG